MTYVLTLILCSDGRPGRVGRETGLHLSHRPSQPDAAQTTGGHDFGPLSSSLLFLGENMEFPRSMPLNFKASVSRSSLKLNTMVCLKH